MYLVVVAVLACPCLGKVTVTDMREWGNTSLAAGGRGDKKVGESLLILFYVPIIIYRGLRTGFQASPDAM